MATHTGGNKHSGVHAGVVAGDLAPSTTRFNDKDVPQFAPNYSVYVLPPDAVCFYSEDRKFFLHGELFCIVADAIAAGKNFGQIVRELTKQFPADVVDQAIKRLIDRRYIVPKRKTAVDAAAGYWATLGIPLEMAAKNLQTCKVRVQSVDAKGAKQLGAALKKLGVRVVDRSADLTVVLVDDYLEGQLEQLNRQHLSGRTPWLLVQPSGVFPLVGPVFSPGKGPCWTCLAERMKRNREVRAMLDRREARRVAVSPLAKDSLGHSGIELAAVEIAKAIASDFRTPLNDHLISLDLSGPTIVKHYVPRRPQCPSCGPKKLRDPRREPVPLVLTAGAKPIMTSGGYRSVSSRATVAKYRKHVSPLTGVVSKLERVEVDLPLNTNYYASHNFSGPAKSIHELRSGRSGGSFGKGSTSEQGEASALMEAIERYSGIFQGDEVRVARRFADFAPGEAIWPNDVLLFSEAQYRRPPSEEDVTPTPPPFDPNAKIEWTPVWSLRDQRFKYLPTGMLYFFHTDASDSHMHADSNGCAAGNTLEEAIVQGFLELVERDSYAIWWYNRSQRTELDLDQFGDSYVRDLKNQLAETGRRLWVLDITSDLGIPSYVAMSYSTQNGQEFVEYGSGSHFDPRIALLRSLTEVNQFLSLGLMGLRDAGQSSNDSAGPFRLKEHPYLIPDGKPAIRPHVDMKFGSLDTREQALACVDIAKRAGLDFLVLDQTRPDIETPVARVIVPGLRHFYRRFGPGRLYDVPVKLGLRDTPIPESELNPLHPHT
ncbi:MAG TPA: TOMM precursor leader peptide-binding protein [Xanthobacteraceae bacterium]|nr:TOMM precursor leader peptide-binding protein [Xanthobacteraceae bacterium]